MFRFRRPKPQTQNPAAVGPQFAAPHPGRSSHWIETPSTMAQAATNFGVSDHSQEVLLKAVHDLAPIESVVDFGTGRGSWLKAALELGISDVRGYDIPEIPVEQRQFPAEKFIAADLGQPVDIERRFDLAISTEVAEHLPKEHAATFIANVSGASDLVLFSAAIPYQGGAGHVNENWVEYWAKLFAAQGFECFDILRLPFWNEPRIRSYYRQNLLLFAKGGAADALRKKGHAAAETAPSLVHPEQYLKAVGRALPPALATVGADVFHYYDCVTKTPSQVDANPDRPTYGQFSVGFGAIKKYLNL